VLKVTLNKKSNGTHAAVLMQAWKNLCKYCKV